MSVVIVSRTPRDGGLEEVVIAKEGIRFTITVPSRVADSPTALEFYEHAADTMRKEIRRVQDVLAPGQEV